MPIQQLENNRTFHLYNDEISYIMQILENGKIGQLYFGKRIHGDSFSHLFERAHRGMAVNIPGFDRSWSNEHIKYEYPTAFTGDFRYPALDAEFENGSRSLELSYKSSRIYKGKEPLEGLPSMRMAEEEGETLEIVLEDSLTHLEVHLYYSIYNEMTMICRHTQIVNRSKESIVLRKAASMSLDLPDQDYQMITLTGAWSRERNIKCQDLHQGYQSIYSIKGHSSANFNPFLALKRKETTENTGEAIGFSLIYSGNFEAGVDLDTFNTTRVQMGIHPFTFKWPLNQEDTFTTPEAVMVYSDKGLNGMSQIFHTLFRENLAHGKWAKEPRPILLNSWEGVYFDFDEDKILSLAKEAERLGIELLVMDDGWFKGRNDDTTSLGDWMVDTNKLPSGIAALSKKVKDTGLAFGLWIEPEMISQRSNLYKEHPDWMFQVPLRKPSPGRNQYVLDFSRKEVVEAIFKQLCEVLDSSEVSYIKWDMNRAMSDVYSFAKKPEEQGMVYHQYILGVYSLYQKMIDRYPQILFESCASGGARFDPGMLYYAPQCWVSDDTDAIERLKIQYGTSMVYPISSMGAHVSAVPNHQLLRNTPLETRGNVAAFGTFGYELDVEKLSPAEKEIIKEQIRFMKKYRKLIQFGTFYRLKSPFDGNETAWMVVNKDKSQAIVGYYRTLQEVNQGFRRLKLEGLDPLGKYHVSLHDYEVYGDELMYAGLIISDASSSESTAASNEGDFISRLYILNKI